MNITTHLNEDYWLSVEGLKRKLDYSESFIRESLRDACRGGVVAVRKGKNQRRFYKSLNYSLELKNVSR